MKTPIRSLLTTVRLSRWIRWLARSSQPRLIFVAALAALAVGGVAKLPSAGSGLLERVGSWPGFVRGPASDVAIAGHYAYVAIGEGGLVVLDVADPAKPVRVGGYLPAGRTQQVRVVGSRAYLGTMVHRGGGCEMEGWRGHLVILDVSDPANPTPLGNYITGSEISSLYVDGDRVYLGDCGSHTECSFRILDVSNPARPVTLSVDQTGIATAIWAGDGRAYTGDWSSLYVWDVTQPASPTVVTNLSSESGEPIRGIQAVGHLLYVISGDSDSGKLIIYDTSQPSAPRSLATLDLHHTALDLQVDGSYAYLAMADAGLAAIDVSDPSKPVRVGTCDTAGAALQVEVADGHAFVADHNGGLQVIDIHDPSHMGPVSSFDTGLTTREIRVLGEKAYLLSSEDNAYPPVSRANGGVLTRMEALSRVEVVDVSNPTRPTLLGAYDSTRVIGSLDVAGDLAYLGWTLDGASGLQILDLRNPVQPALLSDTTNSPPVLNPYAIGVRVSGHYAYVTTTESGEQTSYTRLRIFDVNDPIKPVWLNRTSSTTVGAVGGAAWVAGDLVYVNTDSQFEVWNVADPKAPAVVGSGQGGNGVGGLCVSDDYAYAGRGWNGFSIIDVRSPAKPVAVGEYDTVGKVHGLWVEGPYAYVAEGWQGLEVFDVSNPAQPFPIGSATTRGQARGVQVSGNYAYVAEGGSGLAILSLSPGPVTVVEDPTSLNAALGDTATLTVRAYGRGPLSYQWYRGESGDVFHPVAGANGASFTTPVLTAAAAYWVRVSNGTAISDSRTAWINPVAPVSLELLGLWPGWRRGSATDVQVAGSLAYIAAGDAGLMIYDLADPSAPRRLGGFDTKGWASGVALSGKLAFVACGDKGLRVIDVSQPTAPEGIGSLEPGGYANKVVVVGAYAYLLGDQLRILDVSDPMHPQAVGSYQVNGTNLEVLGRSAFVVGYRLDDFARIDFGFLKVIDVNNPSDPRLLGEYETTGRANGVAVAGNYAYLAIGSRWDSATNTQRPGGLQVIDVSDPYQPRLLSRFNVSTDDDGRDVSVSGAIAYLAGGPTSLQIIDVSNPTTPKRLGGFGTNDTASAVTTSGERAYVSAGDSGVQIIDVAAPTSPKLLGVVPTGGFGEDVAVSGQQAFLADGAGGLKIIDIRDATRPILAGVYSSNVRRVAADAPFLYMVADTFQVLDVSDPTRPTRIAHLEKWGSDILLAGDYVYLGGRYLFRKMDVRNPSEPEIAVSQALSGEWATGGMSFLGRYAGVAQNWGGLQILDLSVPTEPKSVGAYFAEAPVIDVAMRGDIACVILGSERQALEVIDLRDLQRPARTARVSLPLAINVAFLGSYACVTGEGLQVFDLGDPHQPVRVGSHKLGAETQGLQVVGNLVYVAAGEYGLAIYRLTPQLKLNPPVLDGSGLRLSWLGAQRIRLQRATNLSDRDWQDVPNSEGVSNLQLSPTDPAAFFRLVKP